MTIGQLLSALFNLGAQTNFWNSNAAARDFWLAFAALVIAALAATGYAAVRHRRAHRGLQHFGHSLR